MEEPHAFKTFKKKAGIAFKDRALLMAAFTHRSYLNETHIKGEHNERLEFLGDAVLELAVTDLLYRAYPTANEGELTSYRASLVNTTMLGGIAEGLGVNDCMLLSRGEAKDTGRARVVILANALEAIVGALYLDQGFGAARDFVGRHVMGHLDEVVREGSFRDAKSRFQEFAQEKYGITPSYETVSAEGPDHARVFVVSVSVGENVVATGKGPSKQEAEQVAAREALRKEA
jgi:ribonuclease-3